MTVSRLTQNLGNRNKSCPYSIGLTGHKQNLHYLHQQHVGDEVVQKCGQQAIFIILQALPVMFSQGQVPKQETRHKSVLRRETSELTEEAEFAYSHGFPKPSTCQSFPGDPGPYPFLLSPTSQHLRTHLPRTAFDPIK